MPRADDVIPLPDFRGITGRVQEVSDLLEEAQGQQSYFENLRIGSGHAETDTIKITLKDGSVIEGPTYKDRLKQLTEGIDALWRKNQDIAEELMIEASKRRKARERFHEQDDGLRRYANTPNG